MEYAFLAITTVLGMLVWLSGYLTGKKASHAELRSQVNDLLQQIEDVKRSVDAVDWLHSPEDVL